MFRRYGMVLLAGIGLCVGMVHPVNAADPITAPGNHDVTLTVGNLQRRFVVHVPPQYDANTMMPLVVMLHGAGGDSENVQVETGWDQMADEVGFIVLYPNATPTFPRLPENFLTNPQVWNDGSGRGLVGFRDVDDIGFIKAMLDDVKGQLKVDPQRIFVTGFSSGASMTWRVGAELSDEVAAIAPVSGHSWLDNIQLKRHLPVLFIIGTQDPLNPLNGGTVTLPWGNVTQYHPPVQESIDTWAKLDGCPATGSVDSDVNGVKRTVYAPCSDNVSITYYTIEGMGHVWPGGIDRLPASIIGSHTDKMKATDVIWDWFMQHPMAN